MRAGSPRSGICICIFLFPFGATKKGKLHGKCAPKGKKTQICNQKFSPALPKKKKVYIYTELNCFGLQFLLQQHCECFWCLPTILCQLSAGSSLWIHPYMIPPSLFPISFHFRGGQSWTPLITATCNLHTFQTDLALAIMPDDMLASISISHVPVPGVQWPLPAPFVIIKSSKETHFGWLWVGQCFSIRPTASVRERLRCHKLQTDAVANRAVLLAF